MTTNEKCLSGTPFGKTLQLAVSTRVVARQLIAILLVLGVLSPCANATTRFALSASRVDVEAAITAAREGDTVVVPEGTAIWTNTLAIRKSIILKGAGIGRTIILDDIIATNSGPSEAVLYFSTVSNRTYRLTGFEFRQGLTRTTTYYRGAVQVFGTSLAVRIDNCRFQALRNRGVQFWSASAGVIDHCQFDMGGNQPIAVHQDTWGGKNFGDGSWAAPTELGTTNALYVEDNIFTNSFASAAIDSYAGSRWVFRYNTLLDSHISAHGTESSQRFRGTRSFEIYGNTMYNSKKFDSAIHLRSGTGVIWSNTVVGFKQFVVAVCYRSTNPFPPFGGSNGSNPWDKNIPTVFARGNASADYDPRTLIVPGANWTVNQWVGYTLVNTNTKFFSLISSNSADTCYVISAKADSTTSTPTLDFSVGDGYEVRYAYPTLDQVGRGQSSLISGSSPTPVAWPNQLLDPIYEWGNTLDGDNAQVTSSYPVIRAGRDFHNDTIKSGYVPLTYPHPLVVRPEPPPRVWISEL